MGDFERINTPRVERILETLDLIAKSARSQRLEGAFEHAALLRPVLDRLTELGTQDAAEIIDKPATPAPAPRQERLDMQLADMAREAPMKDLVRTIAVFLTRLDEELKP